MEEHATRPQWRCDTSEKELRKRAPRECAPREAPRGEGGSSNKGTRPIYLGKDGQQVPGSESGVHEDVVGGAHRQGRDAMLLREHRERGGHQRRAQPRLATHPAARTPVDVASAAPAVPHVGEEGAKEEYGRPHVRPAHHARHGLGVDRVGGEEERGGRPGEPGVGRERARQHGEKPRRRHVQRHISHVVGPGLEL